MLSIWQGFHLAPAGREGGRERRVERYASFTGGPEQGLIMSRICISMSLDK